METAPTWSGVVIHDTVQFGIIVGLIYLVVNLLLAKRLAGRKIQPRRIGWRQQIRELSYTLSTLVIFSTTGWLIFGPLRPWLNVYDELCEFSFGIPGMDVVYVGISLMVTILLHDAYFYWTHRLMHHPRLYRRFHHLHHRSITTEPTTAYAFAPGEAVINALFLPVIAFFVPLHPVTLTLFVVIMIARNAIAHCGYELFPRGFVLGPLRWSTTVTHHDLHHQYGSGNYGFYFSWWDRLMGTERHDYVARFREVTEGVSLASTQEVIA